MNDEQKARRRAWYQENKDRINDARRATPRPSTAGDPKVAERNRRYYTAHRDQERVRHGAYYEENKEELLARRRTPEGQAQYRMWAAARKSKRDTRGDAAREAALIRDEAMWAAMMKEDEA